MRNAARCRLLERNFTDLEFVRLGQLTFDAQDKETKVTAAFIINEQLDRLALGGRDSLRPTAPDSRQPPYQHTEPNLVKAISRPCLPCCNIAGLVSD